MSICENQETCPRGRTCRNCSLGKPGYVAKVVNWKIQDEENRSEINKLAGEIWLKRGGGISSPAQQIADTIQAENVITKKLTLEVCTKIS